MSVDSDGSSRLPDPSDDASLASASTLEVDEFGVGVPADETGSEETDSAEAGAAHTSTNPLKATKGAQTLPPARILIDGVGSAPRTASVSPAHLAALALSLFLAV